MMKRIVAFLIGFTLSAQVAFAELSEPAKQEIINLWIVSNTLAQTGVQVGNAVLQEGNETNRPAHAAALLAAIDAMDDCMTSLRWMFGDVTEPDRSVQLSTFYTYLDSCGIKALTAATAIDAVPRDLSSLATRIRNAKINGVDGFDRTLDYSSPNPDELPSVIGPHGDFAAAQHETFEAVSEWVRGTAASIKLFQTAPIVPAEANFGFRELWRYVMAAIPTMAKVAIMENEVVLVTDATKIQGDLDAGTGIRSFNFFRVIREAELFTANRSVHPNLVSGRQVDNGLSGIFQVGLGGLQDAVGVLAAANPNSEITAGGYVGPTYQIVNYTLPRRLGNAALRFSFNGWKHFDQVFFSWFGFFHEQPQPPPVGGLTCGPGTHEEDGQCLPDEIPVCPSFEAELVLLDGVTGEARCVQVP